MIFRGSGPILLGNPIFCDFSGPNPLYPSGSVHALCADDQSVYSYSRLSVNVICRIYACIESFKTICILGNLHAFLSTAVCLFVFVLFFQNHIFRNIISDILSECKQFKLLTKAISR